MRNIFLVCLTAVAITLIAKDHLSDGTGLWVTGVFLAWMFGDD